MGNTIKRLTRKPPQSLTIRQLMSYEFDLQRKKFIVTGSSSGYGLALSKLLTQLNGHVIGTVRSTEKSKPTLDSVREHLEKTKPKNPGVFETMQLELTSFDSVRNFAQEYQAKHSNLHALVNNAGIGLLPEFKRTVDGFEETYQVNLLSPYYLTTQLVPLLRRGVRDYGEPSKILFISSKIHHYPRDETFLLERHWNDPKEYQPNKQYAYSKLAAILVMLEMAERLESYQIHVNALDPVGSLSLNTNFHRYSEEDAKNNLMTFLRRFKQITSPDKAAYYALNTLANPDHRDTTGEYFTRMNIRLPSRLANNEELCMEMLDQTEYCIYTALKEKHRERQQSQK
ncbi:hypothetical protein FDP41_013153 [Naegleria fowleri]|uniref:Short-chain dehydrogenase n=1 Tax=Naegleria fowleri TaxID=5763 RepID=A0A6A5C480_NAEFO|nr:uncharacterized protein FDP41_013153 [Naegleria fowleri]KAF0980670.1 hypothetical protein FDP41_013153 [Naegleria fowleri]CAG4708907.1 unnamed protein product [Naegleria fowleri]